MIYGNHFLNEANILFKYCVYFNRKRNVNSKETVKEMLRQNNVSLNKSFDSTDPKETLINSISYYLTGWNDGYKNGYFVINGKKKNKLNDKLYIYRIAPLALKIDLYDELTVKEAMDKYNIKYQFVDTSSRDKIIISKIKEAQKIFEYEYKVLSKGFDFKGCISYGSKEVNKETIEDCLALEVPCISIASLDLWKYNPKARTEPGEELWEAVYILKDNVNNKLKDSYIDIEGDWDDQVFVLYFNKI